MKKLFFILLLVAGYTNISLGQCAISFSRNESAVGYAYRAKNDDPITADECEGKANLECKNRGGTNCKTIYKGDVKGWCGVLLGYNAKFLEFYTVIDGMTGTKEDAENELMKEFHKQGGKDIKTPRVYVWWVNGHY